MLFYPIVTQHIRSTKQPLNRVKRLVCGTRLAWTADTCPSSWFLLMSHHLITIFTITMGIQYVASEHTRSQSSFVENGILIVWLGSSSLSISCRFSVLPALSLDGILAVKIIEGSFTTKQFKAFVDGLLDHMTPFPGPNSVIVMDNCWIHHTRAVWDMIEEWFVVFHTL